MDIEEKMAIQRGANPNVNQRKDAQLLVVRSQIKIKYFLTASIWAKIKRSYNFCCQQEYEKKNLTIYIEINQINMIKIRMLIDRRKVNKLRYTYIKVYSATIKKQ